VRPVITLTTDFGDAGPFVGVMKAVILRHAPDAPIHDLTHRIAPCHPAEAGFWLARSWAWFPAGSVHVAVVDPGVGTTRDILACEWQGHLFLAPDNGILPMIVGTSGRAHALSAAWRERQGWPAPSRTFHGRDIFAPLAAALLTGRAHVADIGPEVGHPVPAALPPPASEPGRVIGRVVAIDGWGNLITDIEERLLRAMRAPRVEVGDRELRITGTYGEAPPGALLALVNSFGTLEIAWREGNAAQLLGLGHGAIVRVIDAPP
jgi:S-adenosylmethionine hydrolase